MYARETNGQTLTFSGSGKLWDNSLVMFDQETGSNWSQLLGEAVLGPLKGDVLQRLPSLLTDWTNWKTKHPDTTVALLERRGHGFRRKIYDIESPVWVIGLVVNEQSRSWHFDQLHKHPVINDNLSDRRLLVLFKANNSTAYIFDRTLDGDILTFKENEGQLIDHETQSVWDPLHGRCIEGRHFGKQLTLLPGIVSHDEAWESFYPDSTTWSPGK